MAAGPVELKVLVPRTTTASGTDGGGQATEPIKVSTAADGSTLLSLTVGDKPATVALVSAGTLKRGTDGSVSILDSAGVVRGGLAPPMATTTASDANPNGLAFAQVDVLDATHAQICAKGSGVTTATATGESTGSSGETTVTIGLGTQALESAVWGNREGGDSLAVDPTPWARHAGEAGTSLVWSQLIAAEPAADTQSMKNQLECHAIGATEKDTWNLEPWRPDVGLLQVIAARCNPT